MYDFSSSSFIESSDILLICGSSFMGSTVNAKLTTLDNPLASVTVKLIVVTPFLLSSGSIVSVNSRPTPGMVRTCTSAVLVSLKSSPLSDTSVNALELHVTVNSLPSASDMVNVYDFVSSSFNESSDILLMVGASDTDSTVKTNEVTDDSPPASVTVRLIVVVPFWLAIGSITSVNVRPTLGDNITCASSVFVSLRFNSVDDTSVSALELHVTVTSSPSASDTVNV
ncbi:MAG: hypothetical protein OMM_05295 [Candidatus Magnetoglobus multicellularis str. Araruama]|uniref:Uncharacterized protein n=1 Tax=Candidatus Magnetoglobus multicellularis str. Araruama TaxID=890399 RepID=A0A1V1NX30_9BACT|nr:MAG: hypothetical protein OMM_05295 [Candidatus Magnetoglobus multicellularis str. Araruama]